MAELKQNDKFLADIVRLGSISEDGWSLLLAEIGAIPPTTKFPDEVSSCVAGAVDRAPDLFSQIGGSELSRMIRGLVYLRIVRAHLGDELLVEISEAIEVAFLDAENRILLATTTASQLIEKVKTLLALDNLYLSAKAYVLSGEYETILNESRLITDIRPVFDDSSAQAVVKGFFINHMLRLKVFQGEQDIVLNIAFDMRDLEILEEQILRARQKANAICVSLAGGALGRQISEGS